MKSFVNNNIYYTMDEKSIHEKRLKIYLDIYNSLMF